MNINEKFGFNANTPFEEKYKTVVKYLGEEKVRSFLPVDDIDHLKRSYSNDKHLNNIPLKKWDAASGYYPATDKSGRQIYKQLGKNYYSKDNPHNLAELLMANDITSFSVSECVCILKECARMWAEEELEKENSEIEKE